MASSSLKRGKPLKRGKALKRGGPLRRKSRLPKPLQPTEAAINRAERQARIDFRQAAIDQRVCAVCGRVDTFDAHHVIERQYLIQNGHAEFVTRNALRVCDRFSKNDCHGKHTRRSRKIRLKELTEDNLIYGIELLGPDKAEVYLRRHYKGNDPRLDDLLEEARDG